MPGIILHQLLAHRVLRQWRTGAADAPFDPDDAVAERAFFQGAIGPDIGYYPGAARALSDLVHASRSADMARAMLRRARSPAQRAYAWGWVTHLLADVAVHPLIERQAVRVLTREASGRTGRDRLIAHLRVEAGLDAYVLSRHTSPPQLRFATTFSRHQLRFVSGAYRETYGRWVSVRDLRDAHAAVARFGPAVVSLTRLAAVAQTLARAMARSTDRRARLHAYAPVAPTGSLIRDVRRATESFAATFHLHHASGLRHLGNHNLTSGAPDEADGDPFASPSLASNSGGVGSGRQSRTGLPVRAELVPDS